MEYIYLKQIHIARIFICFGKEIRHIAVMKSVKYVVEEELAGLAKKYRIASGKSKSDVAREFGIKPPSVHHAEESPDLPYTKLRRRMIEAFSNAKVTGPLFRIELKD